MVWFIAAVYYVNYQPLKGLVVHMIPKHNIARIGSNWLRVIKKITETPYQILKRYSKRKSNKSTFSADKRRFN